MPNVTTNIEVPTLSEVIPDHLKCKISNRTMKIIGNHFATMDENLGEKTYLLLILLVILICTITLVLCNTPRQRKRRAHKIEKKDKKKHISSKAEKKRDNKAKPMSQDEEISKPSSDKEDTRKEIDKIIINQNQRFRDSPASMPSFSKASMTTDLTKTPTPKGLGAAKYEYISLPQQIKKAVQPSDKEQKSASITTPKVASLEQIIKTKKDAEETDAERAAERKNAMTIDDVLEGRAVAPCVPAYETLFAVLPDLAASQRGVIPAPEPVKAQQQSGAFRVISPSVLLQADKEPWRRAKPVKKRSQKELKLPQGPGVSDVLAGKAVAPGSRDYETFFGVTPGLLHASQRKNVKK